MKYALVTGGSRGIGSAIAKTISKDHGYHVLINYASNTEAANATLAEIVANGGTGEIIQFRVEDNKAVKEALEGWMENNPGAVIECVVNNAGITRDNLLPWIEEKDWDDVVNTSLKGFYNVTHTLIHKILRHRAGRIVNVVSLSGLKGVAGQTNYSAAKGGMIAATKALAQEVARRGITVNAVAPGFIKSDMTAKLPEKELKNMIPAKRFGETQEVADVVSFLVSDKASYVTGEVININGGMYS
jgi:3-oxoacyl-[acyl-carrier protein] reductase